VVVDEHSIRARYGLPVRRGYFLELNSFWPRRDDRKVTVTLYRAGGFRVRPGAPDSSRTLATERRLESPAQSFCFPGSAQPAAAFEDKGRLTGELMKSRNCAALRGELRGVAGDHTD
jgi:hypothetical protein